MKLFIFLFAFLFLNSCVTSNFANTHKINSDNNIYAKIAVQIKNGCFQSVAPQFLADLTTSNNSVPPLQMEGVWEQNFNLLKMRVIDPLGKEYGAFNLADHTLVITGTDESPLQQNLGPLLSLISTIGARGLRNFICGHYAFQSVKAKDGIYYIDDTKQYFTISTLNLNGHSIEVQSSIDSSNKSQMPMLTLKSRFFYGLFSKDTDVKVTWIGLGDKGMYSPSYTSFSLNRVVYSILFSDYQ